MKLVLLHGSAINASRIKLQELKNKNHPDNVLVFAKGESVETVLINLQSVSLFEGERLIAWENPPEDLSFDLSRVTSQLSFVLWFDHEISEKKPVMQWFKQNNGQILYFPEAKEPSVFPFLDLLAAKDKKAFLELTKLKSVGFDTYYFITMVFYLLRNLAVTPKNAPQFVRDKLQRQRRDFDREQIIKLYKTVLEIDFKIKSGLLEKEQADFILVNMFLI